jgi:nucleoside-diphosphate-sugar epimerase
MYGLLPLRRSAVTYFVMPLFNGVLEKLTFPPVRDGQCLPENTACRMRADSESWPERIESEEQLDDVLTRPGAALADFIKSVPSPLLLLGAGGKMGPTLAMLARRAAEAAKHPLEVVAVSRFSDARAREWLEKRGIRTASCDLFNARDLDKLPDATSVIYLVGLKFGTAKNPAMTWAANTIIPTRVAERFAQSQIVALSTGNVYPLSEVKAGGSIETDSLTPVGEYANAAVARERIFEFHARNAGTRMAFLRLFYAVELRYGVLVDIAQKVHAGETVDLTNGYFNCIWQGDANEMVLRALALGSSPPAAWNLCRPEVFSVREAAVRLGELLGRPPNFVGTEAATALLGNSSRLWAELGRPHVSIDLMLSWIADWVKREGRNLGRPTHFEVRDGKY